MSKIVKIKLIEKKGGVNTFNGFVRYRNTKDYITPYYDERGLMYTGLTEEDRERLSKELQVDLRPSSPYWHDFKIVMTDKVHELYVLKDSVQELQYLFLTGGHKRIANSITDADFGIKDYYIVDENKEAEVANNKAAIKIKANKLFSSLSTENKKDILKLYPGFTGINLDTTSSDIIEAKLYAELEKDSIGFINKAEDKKRDTKILIKDLVQATILRKNKSSFYYGDDFIGHDEESAISYIDDPVRQSLKVDLMAQLSKQSNKKK